MTIPDEVSCLCRMILRFSRLMVVQVDIIVCGGGSCGCVVAGRLANLDHNLQVLLIEGGETNLNNPW
jgi:ribulose 1,5-bisphosphate synthetase/thiazole synthase